MVQGNVLVILALEVREIYLRKRKILLVVWASLHRLKLISTVS